MKITYSNSCDKDLLENLEGFFVGWEHKPAAETFLKLLQKSDYRIIARDGHKVVGFITAISDGVLCANIPFVEVLPEYQKQGIGESLVKQMLEQLKGYYMIDLLCDEEVQGFYEKLGMKKSSAMMIRNYENQTGISDR